MTKQQRAAVRVAKDVIAQLDAELLEARQGHYTIVPGIYNQPWGSDLKGYLKTLAKEKTACSVCALGACFLANVRKTNNVSTFGSNFDRADIEENLADIFSPAQMDLIECAFEQTDAHNHDTLTYDEAMVAVAFGNRYDNSTKRLKAIMRNIIRNNGEFVPTGLRKVQRALKAQAAQE